MLKDKKCDAAKPKCERCQRINKDCLWDPNDQENLTFMNENSFAQGQRRRPRRKVTPLVDEPTTLISRSSKTSPTSGIPQNLHDVAFCYWLENFVFAIRDLPEFGHEYGTYVLPLWISTRPGSSLHLAVSALSLAIFGQVKHSIKAIEAAKRFHTHSIAEAHKLMKQIPNEHIDHLLLTIMLMSSYEARLKTQNLNFPANTIPEYYLCRESPQGDLTILRIRKERISALEEFLPS